MLRYAFSLTGRRAVSEEIVQQVFLELHVRLDSVDVPKAWLVRSVRNRSLDYLRRNRRELLDGVEHEPGGGRKDPTVDAVMCQIETTRCLRTLIEKLGDLDQQLVKLKYYENLGYREISQQTGLSVGNVGYRLHHLLKGLAAEMRSLGFDNT